jgi:hypothetical protein
MSKYFAVSSDNDRDMRISSLKGKKWQFVNLFPFSVNVYVYRVHKLDLIGEIKPHGVISTDVSLTGMVLEAGDEIHVTYPTMPNKDPKNGAQYEVVRPVFLFADSRMVRIGDVGYQDNNNTRVDIHHDIMGIRIRNHVLLPLDIYYKGHKLASIEGDDDTSFMSGSKNSVYLNNDRFGFQIGDEIGFVFPSLADGKPHPYGTIRIVDNYMSDIVIGIVNQHFTPTRQDMFSYRVDTPNITGLKYFESVSGYESQILGSSIKPRSARGYLIVPMK